MSAGFRPHASHQIGTRQFPERVVLQALRTHGSMPKTELVRITTLGIQAVALIIKRLIDEGLIIKLETLRGKIGEPSVSFALNPEGALSIGIKVGRRSMDILLLDFLGQVRERFTLCYSFPDPEELFAEIDLQLKKMRKSPGLKKARRLSGIGIAAPLTLSGWHKLLNVHPHQANQWLRINFARQMQDITVLPVQFCKDTAAACVAELVTGEGRNINSFLYIFVDTFIGGGVVIDGHLRGGLHGNAGALASIPVRLARPDDAALPEQLLSEASLITLERTFVAADLDPLALFDQRVLEEPWLTHTRTCLDGAGCAIGLAIDSATCLLDLDAVIIDGSCDRALLEKLRTEIERAMNYYCWEGIARPAIHAGTIGSNAHAIGAALLPLYANFAPNHSLFIKENKRR